MRAGKLRNRATIYEPATTTNDFGEVAESFVSIGTFACSVTTLVKREYAASDTVVSKTEYDLRFRYYPKLATISRDGYIVVKGIELEIKSVANVQLRDREIQMLCEARS